MKFVKAGVVALLLVLGLVFGRPAVSEAQNFSAQIQLALRNFVAGNQTITGNWTCSGTCTGFGGGVTLGDTQVAFGNGANVIGGDSKFIFSDSGGTLPLLKVGLIDGTNGGVSIAGTTTNPAIRLYVNNVSGGESQVYFGHVGTQDWRMSSNDEGNNDYEWTLAEATNSTYKIEAFKGTNGEVLLNQSGGNVGIGVAPAATTEKLTVNGNIRPTGYKSSDGSAGVTVAVCTSFKNGLCVAGT